MLEGRPPIAIPGGSDRKPMVSSFIAGFITFFPPPLKPNVWVCSYIRLPVSLIWMVGASRALVSWVRLCNNGSSSLTTKELCSANTDAFCFPVTDNNTVEVRKLFSAPLSQIRRQCKPVNCSPPWRATWKDRWTNQILDRFQAMGKRKTNLAWMRFRFQAMGEKGDQSCWLKFTIKQWNLVYSQEWPLTKIRFWLIGN